MKSTFLENFGTPKILSNNLNKCRNNLKIDEKILTKPIFLKMLKHFVVMR
jgi:hypothetical protein